MLGDSEARWHAATLLARMDARLVVPGLERALRAPEKREGALHALRELGPAASAATPAIARVVRNGADAGVQIGAFYALSAIGPGAAAAEPELLRALATPGADSRVVGCAISTLAKLRPASKATVDALTKLIEPGGKQRASEGYRRGTAALALGQIGPAARSATPALEAMLLDESPIARVHATAALAAITGDTRRYLPLLLLARRDVYGVGDRYSVMEFILEGLTALGPSASAATSWLTARLDDVGSVRADEDHIPQVVQTLRAIGPRARPALPRLKRLAVEGKPSVRALAAEVVRSLEGNTGPKRK
jgi:HEAT repeat protein